jgi:transposase-like protein
VDHRDNKFSNGRSHINWIESFWSFAKRRLQKFNGVGRENFNLHLKESEFRFNNRDKVIYKLLLKHLNQKML